MKFNLGWSGVQGSNPRRPFGGHYLPAMGGMQVQNKRPRNASVLGNAGRARVTKLSPEAMIGPPQVELHFTKD